MRIKLKIPNGTDQMYTICRSQKKKNSLRLVIFLSKLSIAVNKIEIRNRKM